jgi:hypothetical protein
MPRTLAGLLAAFGAAMSGLAGIANGALSWMALSLAVMAAGALACLSAPTQKKSASMCKRVYAGQSVLAVLASWPCLKKNGPAIENACSP